MPTAKKLPHVKPRRLKEILQVLEGMANPPALMIYGVPGIGKTQIIKDYFGDADRYEVRVKHLSRMDPTDWSGIPKQDGNLQYTEFLPIKLFKPPENNRRLVLFFDELNTAMPQVLNAALDIILEKSAENARLNQDTIIIAAGNLGDEDGTFVEKLSSAVKTRLIQVVLETDAKDWIEWAGTKQLHPNVINYIKKHEQHLIHLEGFKQDHDQIATPRGWERVSDILFILQNQQQPHDGASSHLRDLKRDLVLGILGHAVGEEFLKYLDEPPGQSENQWKASIDELRVVYRKEAARQIPENYAKLIELVAKGLAEGYTNARTEAENLTGHLEWARNAGYLSRANVTALGGRNIRQYLDYLKNSGNHEELRGMLEGGNVQ